MNTVDVSRGFPVETRTRRVLPSLRVNPLDAVMKTKAEQPLGSLLEVAEDAFGTVPPAPPAPPAVPPRKAPADETPHQKVFRLVRERQLKEASRLAARLINAGDINGFFIYGSGPSARRAEEWFESQFVKAKRKAFAEIFTVTPAMAQVMLLRNEGNRKVKAPSIESAVRDILDGEWDLNGETFKVSLDGLLNDAQHRGFSILIAGAPIESFIAFGLTRKSRRSVDTGGKRTAAERAGMRGKSDYIAKSAIAALAFEIENGRKPGDREVDDFLEENEREIEEANFARGTSINGIGPSIMGVAAMHLLSLGADAAKVKQFFAVIRKNEGTKAGNPARTIHYELYPKDSRSPLKLSRPCWVSTLCHHFIAWERGRTQRAPIIGLPLPEAI